MKMEQGWCTKSSKEYHYSTTTYYIDELQLNRSQYKCLTYPFRGES